MSDPIDRFLELVVQALHDDAFVKLTLATPVSSDGAVPKRVVGRRVDLAAGPRLQLTTRHATQDEVANVAFDDVAATLRSVLGPALRSANLFTTRADHQLQWRGGTWVASKSRPTHREVPSRDHDRPKRRAVDLDRRWLKGLGVLGPDGKVRRGMHAKHQQILRFVELFDHALRDVVAGRRIRLVDMGCGKGFLTFAAWEWLAARNAVGSVVGVERRGKLVNKAEAVARQCGLDGLSFVAGTIADAPLDDVDVVIALHACDTATDDALGRAVLAQAEVVVVAPCCHQEVRPQLEGPAELQAVLRHGILRTKTAEMVTDALRAALLEAQGYRTRIFEFVDADHTDKNLMLTAHRQPADVSEDRRVAPRILAQTYGIEHQRLANILGYPLSATEA